MNYKITFEFNQTHKGADGKYKNNWCKGYITKIYGSVKDAEDHLSSITYSKRYYRNFEIVPV